MCRQPIIPWMQQALMTHQSPIQSSPIWVAAFRLPVSSLRHPRGKELTKKDIQVPPLGAGSRASGRATKAIWCCEHHGEQVSFVGHRRRVSVLRNLPVWRIARGFSLGIVRCVMEVEAAVYSTIRSWAEVVLEWDISQFIDNGLL